MSILPHRFLFRYQFPVGYAPRAKKQRGAGRRATTDAVWPVNVSSDFQIPETASLDTATPDTATPDAVTPFGTVFACWNEEGFGVAVSVGGKSQPVVCDRHSPEVSDGLQVWIDTRNTQTIHRASRFCHHFCLLPGGDGSKKKQPCAVQLPIARSREETLLAEPGDIPLHVEPLNIASTKTSRATGGYELQAWFPAKRLTGFDPETYSQMGFYYRLRDREFGDQFLTVDTEFPVAHDPSLWSTLEFVR